MWLPLTLLVLAGLVSADYEHGWKVGNEYTYLVRSRTFTSLEELSSRHVGILTKALLTVQAKDAHTLIAKVTRPQYARVHNELENGWESTISDQMLEFLDLPMSQRPFEIKLKHGVIKDLIVDKDVPTWEVNVLKSIVSQLQVDTQGENALVSKNVQVPNDEEPYGSFKAMEDSVGGKCEVLYDITPLPEHVLHLKPELVPMPELKGDGHHIDIMKTKNFDNCEQRMNYHFGFTGQTNWEPGSNVNGKFLSKSSTSKIIISGNLKRFTIQSSVTTSRMLISPRFYDRQNGIVVSRMNLTLAAIDKISTPLPLPSNPESTGNLVYIFNNPFSDIEERRPSKVTGGPNSNQVLTSDSISSVSSSEEATKKGQPNLRGSGSSSSGSSSSISSSEEHQFWQPKPTLDDPPQIPLLPNFIGYKGKFIGKSDKIDVVKSTKELVYQIANELENPNDIPAQETLEKFTILCGLISTMSRKQMAEAESNMHITQNELKTNDKSQAVKQNAWAVFRDAITQAGTGPALLTIKSWIERGDIGHMEASDILSRIPKNARTPTAEYVKAFFKLATNPKVVDQPILNTTAIIAFTELVYRSQVNGKSIHNLYPVHTFGRFTSKHDQTVLEEYIPYLARELKKSMKDRDSPKIQTYIMALGNIGHPKILSIFEPYLEGKEQVSVFQRTLMVSALSKLAEQSPKLGRSVLYKIYLNTMESHEVRCMAVFLLTKTNPPLNMLQRMAEFTNYDTSKQVNSAVKSIIESLANLEDPELQDLARKARSVEHLLNPNDYGYQYSHGFIMDSVTNERRLVSKTIFNYIGSDDDLLPRAMYLGLYASYGSFKTPPTELLAMVSSVKPLLNMALKTNEDKQSFEKLATEKLAEELNIIPEEPVRLEGNLMWSTKFLSRFLPFDKNTVQGIPNLLTKYALAMKDGTYVNMNKLMSYDVILSFPTETGLPFVYSLNVPILTKISGNLSFDTKSEAKSDAKSDIRLVYSRKIQGRIGFVAPFEHRHFVAGVDVNVQAYAPMKFALRVDIPKSSMQLKIWPLQGNENARLFHHSVIPYTSIHDILSLRPLLLEKNTHQVHIGEPLSLTLPSVDSETIRLDVEADKSNEDFWSMNFNTLDENNALPWDLDNDQYRKVDLFVNLGGEQNEPVVFTGSYSTMNVAPGAEDPQQWTPTARAVEMSGKGQNSEERKKHYLKEAAKGIKSAMSKAVDLQLQIPGRTKHQQTITVAWARSNVDNKGRTLVNWQMDGPRDSKNEVCIAAQDVITPESFLYYDQVVKSKPKEEFDVDVRYGRTCNTGDGRVNVKGKFTQSDELKETIKKSPVIAECERQQQQGNKILRKCQTAAILAMAFDEIDMSVDVKSKALNSLINKGIGMIGNADWIDADVDTSNPKNAGKQKIDIKAKFSNDFETMDLAIYTPLMDVTMEDASMVPLQEAYKGFLVTDDEMDIRNLAYDADQPSCMLDSTRIETFDGKEYPLRLGNCWHVAMTTYPKANPDKPDEKLSIPEESSVSILSKETETGQKEVKIILGKNKIRLMPSNEQPKVMVNERKIQITNEISHQEREDDEVIFEIYRLKDGSLGLVSEKYEVNVAYDGKRMLIKASNKYRGSLRGLCGNYDNDLTNDFVGPRNCLLRKSDYFIASYALTKSNCEGEALENAKSVQKHQCTPRITNRQSNVISDVESGRVIGQQKKWGYHQSEKTSETRCTTHRTKVIDVDDKICFTTRPVVSCLPTCNATELKSKSHQFHCMERNEAALSLKKRVEKGANPDLSQKPVSMTRTIEVPLACVA